MKITLISAYYPPHLGGQEIAVQSLAQQLAHDHDVDVITSLEGGEPKKENHGRLSITRLWGFVFGHAPIMPRFPFTLWRKARPSSLIHLHIGQAFTPEWTWLVAKLRRVPYIAQLHIDFEPSGRVGIFLPLYKKLILKRVIRGAAAVIVLNQKTATTVRKQYGYQGPLEIIGNGIDEDFFALGRPQFPPKPPEVLKLLFVGRFSRQKNLPTLIEAIARARRPVQLDIIGEGEERTAIEATIAKHNLTNVTLHGRLERTKIQHFYKTHDALILPSLNEAQPMVLLEAMAARIPIIGTNVIGVEEHIKDIGIVTEPTAEGVAAGIEQYDTIYSQLPEMVQRGYEKAENLRWSQHLKRYETLYRQVLKPARSLLLQPRTIAIGLFGWLGLTNVLVALVHAYDWWPLQLLLLGCLFLLPGFALLRALGTTLGRGVMNVLYAFGMSLLVLVISGLLVNITHLFGVNRPLELGGILIAWNLVTSGAIIAGLLMNPLPLRLELPARGLSLPAWPLLFASLMLPFGAAMGAFRLNNGGDSLLAMITLGVAAGLIAYSFLLRRWLPDALLTWFVFSLSLTILLMTSLRGWDIVGHDIAREFRVYTLTSLNGFWDISEDRNPYNACLSITILPVVLAKLLNLSGLWIFKIVLQLAFAGCAAMVYQMVRQHASRLAALVGSVLFICYPTFINDSAMLTRQGVAYLFFALALGLLLRHNRVMQGKTLMILCALGVVLSHYSTSYLFVGLLAGTLVIKAIVRWRSQRPQLLGREAILSPLLVIVIFLMTFTWYGQITATSRGLVSTLHDSIANIPQLLSDDAKSTDTSAVLFFAGGQTQVDLYESYLINQARAEKLVKEHLPGLTGDVILVTPLGRQFQAIGIDPSITTTLRQHFAKALQVLAFAAVIYATYRLLKLKDDALPADAVWLSWAGVGLLALLVILPILSINYGVLRAFQQILIFLVVPMVLTLAWATKNLRTFKLPLATVSLVGLFLLFTSFFGQLLGGVSPSLTLNNSGLYYGLYNAPATDMASFAWMKQHLDHTSDVRAANLIKAAMHDPRYPFTHTGILPSQIGHESFVYLDAAQVIHQRFYTYYESNPLTMTFPLDYYEQQKNQIYSTGSTRIYR